MGCWGREEERKRAGGWEGKERNCFSLGTYLHVDGGGNQIVRRVVGQLGETRDCGWIWTHRDAHGSVHVDLACPWQGRTTLALFF